MWLAFSAWNNAHLYLDKPSNSENSTFLLFISEHTVDKCTKDAIPLFGEVQITVIIIEKKSFLISLAIISKIIPVLSFILHEKITDGTKYYALE